jgi:hypothetical protein
MMDARLSLELAKTNFKVDGKAGLLGGSAALKDNVKWGLNVNKRAADTKKISNAFDNSAVFAAEMSTEFPKSYKAITKSR